MIIFSKQKKEIEDLRQGSEKLLRFYRLLLHWLEIRQEGRSLAEYFEKKEYRNVAIYGMKELGERLYDELKDSAVKVKYCIDKDAKDLYAEVPIYLPEEKVEPVDAVVVTAITSFDDIKSMMSDRVSCPIISLEDVVYGV